MLLFVRHIVLAGLIVSLVDLHVSGQTIPANTSELPADLVVLENWVHTLGRSGIRARGIFIYVQEASFNLEAIKTIFDRYQRDNCDPYILEIYVYSDRAMLDRRIKYEKNPLDIEGSDTDAGRIAGSKYYQKVLGDPQGYFRAVYYRYGDYEGIDYSPKKEDPFMARITIREPEIKSDGGPIPPNVCK